MSESRQPLGRQEQIQILMEEYKTLRTEIIQRMASSFQIWGVAGTAAVAISGFVATYSIWIGILLLPIFILVISLAWRVIEFDTRRYPSPGKTGSLNVLDLRLASE